MDKDTELELSGPFDITDRNGQLHPVTSVRIFNESYGVIDVYVHFKDAIGDLQLFADTVAVGQVLKRLRTLGYDGPDFGHGDLGLQDERLIVLEAHEAFNRFAAQKGWKDLAAEFDAESDVVKPEAGTQTSSALLQSLLRKYGTH